MEITMSHKYFISGSPASLTAERPDVTIIDIRTSLNLSAEEKTMIVKMEEWITPDYENMTLDDFLSEDNKSLYTAPEWEEVREERDTADRLNKVVDLQDRMAKGMAMIKEGNGSLNAYIVAKNAFDKAKDVMFGTEGQKPSSWWDRFNKLKIERDAAYKAFQADKARTQKLWAHWMRLKDECVATATPKVWAQFFSLRDEEINAYFTHESDEGIDHLTAPTEEALQEWKVERENYEREAHIAEMREYDVEVHLPIKTGGYVPPCRDVTHLYVDTRPTTEDEWASILESCPF